MLYFVIPAFNERENIGSLLEDLRPRANAAAARVIVVDDGSADGTAEEVERHATGLSLRLVRHRTNQGLGAALRSGLAAALEDADEGSVIVSIEGDNTSDLDDLPAMLEQLEAGADVVMASFLAPGGRLLGVVRWRAWASRCVSALFRLVAGLREFHQVTPLYRAYRVGAIRRAAALYGEDLITEQGFAVNVELLVKLRSCGASVVEVPTKLDWRRRRGHSKLPLTSTVFRYLRLLVALAARRADLRQYERARP